jgi:hypothetical protein
MDANLALPLDAIEGIGPSLAATLAADGMHVVADLLRVAPERVHESVSTAASIAQVRAWSRMCALLQIDGMTPQWAEALVAAHIESVDEFAAQTPAALRTLFASARAQGRIPDEPAADPLSRMQVDAARVAMGLALSGVVRTSGGAIVPDCVVRVGTIATRTDAHGTFRLTRIPASFDPEVTLDHPDHLLALVRLERLFPSPVLHTTIFDLTRLAPGTTRPVSRLSQLDGDTLPSLAGRKFTTREMARADVRRGDIFQVHSFYESAPDAKLVSKLLDVVDGDVHVRWVRVPRAELPPNAAIGDRLLLDGRGFRTVALDARKLAAYVKLQRARRAIRLLPQPRNLDEMDAVLPSVLEELRKAGVFQRRS